MEMLVCLSYGEFVRHQLAPRIIPPQDNLSHLEQVCDPGGSFAGFSKGFAV
jgi:hypothetical protein